MPVISKITGAPFRFWCQKILPAVYDDSLSYYELLCKVVDYLNKVMEDDIYVVTLVNENEANFNTLQSYVDNYFDNLDVQNEINNKLDAMAEDGSLLAVVAPYIDPIITEYEESLNVDLTEYKADINVLLTAQDTEIENFKGSVNTSIAGQNTEISEFKRTVNTSIGQQDNNITVMQSQISNFIQNHSGELTFTELYSTTETLGAHTVNETFNLSDDYTKYTELDIYWSYNSVQRCVRVKTSDVLATGVEISFYADEAVTVANVAPMFFPFMKIVNGNTAHTQLKIDSAYSERWSGAAADSASRDIPSSAADYSAGSIIKVVGVSYQDSAELQDIRTGANGETYSTAGNAVRRQAGSLFDALKKAVEPVNIVRGSIVGGNNSASNVYVRTNEFRHALKGAVIKASPDEFDIIFSIYMYSQPVQSSHTNSTYPMTVATGTTFAFAFDKETYFRFRACKADGTDLTDEIALKFNNYFTFTNLYTAQGLQDEIDDTNEYIEEIDTIDIVPVIERGSIIGGNNAASTTYARTKTYTKVRKGDTVTITPETTAFMGWTIYQYDGPSNTDYVDAAGAPNPDQIGVPCTYTFTKDCYFRFRLALPGYAAYTDAEVEELQNCTVVVNHYRADDFVQKHEMIPLKIDYTTINNGLSGKVNFAIQTDTHMSSFNDYKLNNSYYQKSDYSLLERCIATINKLDLDGFMNLGDIVRGYEFDPDYETRKSITDIMEYYSNIAVPKFYIIGNHDDGCLFYSSASYNDNRLSSNVLFPHEQFNRITKYGENSHGILNYWYTDISGVRVISLYQRDFDYSASIPGINSFAIGSAQLEWLTNTALNTEMPVVVLTHAPLVSELFPLGGTGFSEAYTALINFVSNGGTLIGVLSGHTHEQNYAQVNTINNVVFKNGGSFFEIMSVDLDNRTVSFTPINNISISSRTYSF